MELTALTLGQLAALFGVSAALVTGLYMLKLRRRTVVVPFVLLWERLLADKQATSLFAQLKRWLSLLLALCLVAFLALAIADPRYTETSNELRHRVVLIDAGITMQAREGKTVRLQQAIEQARHIIAGMGSKDRAMIVQVDRSVTPLSPMTNDGSVLTGALQRIHATDVTTDLRAGLDLATDVLRGRSRPEVIVLSDGASHTGEPLTSTGKLSLTQVRIGKATRDVAITAFAVRRFPLDKTRSELLVELFNSSDQPTKLEIKLSGDGQVIEVQQAELAANERKRLVYDNISGVDRSLQVDLQHRDESHDALRVNDRAFATLPERKRMRVLCVTSGNRYLEAALLLDEYLTVDVTSPDAYVPDKLHDVVIFDRVVPSAPPTQPAIYLAPPSTPERPGPLQVIGTIDRPFFERVANQDALVRHVALRDVNIGSALQVRAEAGDKVIGADARGPLLISGMRNNAPFVALTFDVTQSDLPLRVAWPMLLINALDRFAEQQAGYIDSYRAGERGVIRLGDGDTHATLNAPDGRRLSLPVIDAQAVIDEARAGLYALKTDRRQRPIAINPAPITGIKPRDITKRVQSTEVGTVAKTNVASDQPWSYLLMIAVAILAIEWLTFHRRWTV